MMGGRKRGHGRTTANFTKVSMRSHRFFRMRITVAGWVFSNDIPPPPQTISNIVYGGKFASSRYRSVFPFRYDHLSWKRYFFDSAYRHVIEPLSQLHRDRRRRPFRIRLDKEAAFGQRSRSTIFPYPLRISIKIPVLRNARSVGMRRGEVPIRLIVYENLRKLIWMVVFW